MNWPLLLAVAALGGDYPNSRLLMEPKSLAEQLDQVIVLDVRSKTAFESGHIPGAIRIEDENWRSAFGDGSDAARWSLLIGSLGIDNRKPVVAYDDAAGMHAARIWWILRYWGVEDVRLLNGFWHGWNAAGLPVEKTSRDPTPTTFTVHVKKSLFADKNAVKAASDAGGRDVQIVDARSLEEHSGKAAMKNKRPGAIPGACHLNWTELVDVKGTQRFKSPEALKRLFEKAGVDLKRPIIAHCQGGGRAAVMVFALSVMGGTNAANYHPSFGEWSADENMPVIRAGAK